MANAPVLTINGRELPYWSSVRLNSSIDSLADTISISYKVHSQTPKGDANPLTFDGDELAEVHLDGELLMTGYLDCVEASSSTGGDVVEISGYSRTADLVACPVLATKTYKDQTIEAICKDLCKPFGIDVVVDESATEPAKTKLVRFKAEFAENVADALGRVCRYAGLLLFSSPDGGLQLSRAGSTVIKTELRHGQNIEEVRVTRDARDRHSDYYVASDGVSGIDPDDADKDDGRYAHAVDPGVGRYRPTILSTEQDVKTQSQRKTQAEWERNRRAAMSLHVSCKWTSWKHSEGVWRPNTRVRFTYSKMRIDREMLVSSVSLARESDGSAVQLELDHPSSFEPRTVPLPRRSKARAKYADPEGYPDAPDEQFFENTPYALGEEQYYDDVLYEGEDDGEDYVEQY